MKGPKNKAIIFVSYHVGQRDVPMLAGHKTQRYYIRISPKRLPTMLGRTDIENLRAATCLLENIILCILVVYMVY